MTAKISVNTALPFYETETADELWSAEAVAAMGCTLEKAGFYAGLVTDHPAPPSRWLDSGGHHAPDPFVLLTLLGAATTTLRLQTGVLVLPYRNPFIVARSVATLDHFSGGRVVLSVGAGYLKGEYRALGVDFDRRNQITDEYLRALKASLSGEDFSFVADGFEARGNRIVPAAVQKPHPPLLIGGNSKRAIRRAVELADGWNPFFTSQGGADITVARTAAFSGEADLRAGLSYMAEVCESVGREVTPQVVLGNILSSSEAWNPDMLIDRVGRYHDLGVSALSILVTGRTRNEWCDNAERVGAEVIAKL